MAKSDSATTNATTDTPAKGSVFQRLYTGTGAFDIVGHLTTDLSFHILKYLTVQELVGVESVGDFS